MKSNLNDKFSLLQAFSEAAYRLSFIEAAKALSLTPSTLSRRIKRLEETLAVQLFVRTTRRMALTEAGEIYLHYVERVLADLAEGDNAVSLLGGQPTGVLRVNVPSAFGRIRIAPLVAEFLCRYPDIRLNIIYSDTYVDLIAERVDVAVRIGTPVDSSLHQRTLATNRRYLVAAPSYISRYGLPLLPSDLGNHKCLHFSHLAQDSQWRMEKEGDVRQVPINPVLQANDAQSLYQAACAGAGISLLADFIARPAIADNRLQVVLPEWRIADTDICAVYPATLYIAPKSRAFIDFLVEKLSLSTAI